ncbi:HD domain-containing protein [Clostridium minihomine]|uniref:HD domain-containing protein n=1 Tax=Clostridium minihomine TaxID=2045012 RepID=UPI001A928865|nr:HD domain-containing protein [Clostridium minihomine]
MDYVKLTDKEYNGTVLKLDQDHHYIFVFGPDQWKETGLFLRYLWPDSSSYDCYEEISAEQAEALIQTQKQHYLQVYQKALEIATKAHDGQTDKGGNPYINHPIAVAAMLDDLENKIVAMLHDVLEDSTYTADDLQQAGIDENLIDAVQLLTQSHSHLQPKARLAYLARVKENPIARNVKLADLKHNADLSRIVAPTEKDRQRVKRYQAEIEFLEAENE